MNYKIWHMFDKVIFCVLTGLDTLSDYRSNDIYIYIFKRMLHILNRKLQFCNGSADSLACALAKKKSLIHLLFVLFSPREEVVLSLEEFVIDL